MEKIKKDDMNYRWIIGGVALVVMVVSGYMVLRKPAVVDVPSMGAEEVVQANVMSDAQAVEKERKSRELWNGLNQGDALPAQLQEYVTGVDYEGMKIYFSDLVEIYDQLFLAEVNDQLFLAEVNDQLFLAEVNDQLFLADVNDQVSPSGVNGRMPEKNVNIDKNWKQVMMEAKRQLVLGQVAHQVGLVDLSQVLVFDHEQYLLWQEGLANKYMIKSWEIEIRADSDVSSEQIGRALVSLASSADQINTDEDLTQGVMGLFGDWNMDGSNVKAYVVSQDVAVWEDEKYGRLLSSLVAGERGDWSTIIEVPSVQGKVRYVMAQIKDIEDASDELDNYISTVINKYPDLNY